MELAECIFYKLFILFIMSRHIIIGVNYKLNKMILLSNTGSAIPILLKTNSPTTHNQPTKKPPLKNESV